jgi:WD40 repeat protein
VSPADGRLLVASGSWDKTVRLWDAATGRPVGEPLTGHREGVSRVALCVSPSDGRLLVASGSRDRTVRLWDAATGRPIGEPLTGHSEGVNGVALCVSASDGRLLVASGSNDNTVRLWDAGEAQHLLRSHSTSAGSLCVSGAAHLLWASRSVSQRLDARRVELKGCVGLADHQLALLTYFGCEPCDVASL